VRSFHYWNRYVDSAYRKVGTNVVIAPGAAQMISMRQAHKLGFYRGSDGRLHMDMRFVDPTLFLGWQR
jgi:hypothetical protein